MCTDISQSPTWTSWGGIASHRGYSGSSAPPVWCVLWDQGDCCVSQGNVKSGDDAPGDTSAHQWWRGTTQRYQNPQNPRAVGRSESAEAAQALASEPHSGGDDSACCCSPEPPGRHAPPSPRTFLHRHVGRVNRSVPFIFEATHAASVRSDRAVPTTSK